MEQPALDTVKVMWIDYREEGVETALRISTPTSSSLARGRGLWEGHDGVRAVLRSASSAAARRFTAAPYTFEPLGRA